MVRHKAFEDMKKARKQEEQERKAIHEVLNHARNSYVEARTESKILFDELAKQYNNLSEKDRKECGDLKNVLLQLFDEGDNGLIERAFKHPKKQFMVQPDQFLEKFDNIFPHSVHDFPDENKKFDALLAGIQHLRKDPSEALKQTSAWQDIKHLLELIASTLTVYPLYKRCKTEGGFVAGVNSFFESDARQTLRKIDHTLAKVKHERTEYQEAEKVLATKFDNFRL